MSGGGIGTGAGGLLGTLAGVALAPETGGLSLAIPAATGAAGAELGNAATGNTVNPLMAALMGGISGGIGGGVADGSVGSLFSGASGASGAGADAADAADSASFAPLDSAADSSAGAAGAATGNAGTYSLAGDPTAAQALGANTSLSSPAAGAGAASGAGGAPPTGGGLSSWIGDPKKALQTALLGETGLSAVQSLLPKPKVNTGQTAAQVQATDPEWNATLPKYSTQNTASPYSGNWYTYGQQPEAPQYNAMPVQQSARGGLIKGYAGGGIVSPGNRVNPLASVMPRLSTALRSNTPPMHGSRFPGAKGYAMGGPVMPGAMPPQAAPQQQKVNPLQLAAAHKIGMAIGQHLKAHGYDPNKTPAGPVHGKGGGQDDAVPAKLSDGEFVHSADVVAALGDGSSKEGGRRLKAFDAAVRAHKTSHGSKFPPKAKNPLSYLGAS